MLNKFFPSFVVVLISSLVLLNLAGCGSSDSSDDQTTDAPDNNDKDAESKKQTTDAPDNNDKDAETKKQIELTASTPEEFSQSVIRLLIENDGEQFISFAFPTKEKILTFVAENVPGAEKESVEKKIEEDYGEQRAKILESFTEIRKSLETAGGDWKSAKISATDYDIETQEGITETDIDVLISSNNKTLEIVLDDCFLIDGRWYSMDTLRLKRFDQSPAFDESGTESDQDPGDSPQPDTSSNTEAPRKTELAEVTPEAFSQSVLTLLIAGDQDRFIQFAFPLKQELLDAVLKNTPATRKEKTKQDIEKGYDQHRDEVLKSFAQIREEAKTEGCDWKSAKFVSAEYDISERNGLSQTDIDVKISAGGKTYEIRLDDCLLINGRWYTLDNMRFTE